MDSPSAKSMIAELAHHVEDAQKLLLAITPETVDERGAVDQASRDLTHWQENDLDELQKAFEQKRPLSGP